MAPIDFPVFDRDLVLPGATKLELRGAGAEELAAPEDATDVDPLIAPSTADAVGPNGSTRVAAGVPAFTPGAAPVGVASAVLSPGSPRPAPRCAFGSPP